MNLSTGKNIVCYGDTNIDVHIPFGEMRASAAALERGEFLRASEPFFTVGGSVANPAVVFARLGMPTYMATVIGGDAYGDFALDHFRRYGVRTDFVFRQKEASPLFLAVVDETGERFIARFFGPGAKAPYVSLDVAKTLEPHIPEMGWIYITGCSLGDFLGLVEKAEAAGVRVALDLNLRMPHIAMDAARRELIYRMIAASDVVFASVRDELIPLTGIADVALAARSLLAPGRVVVARDGGAPVEVFCGDERYTVAPPAVKVIDKVGAGDSFSATFITALEHGCPLPEAARWANYVAAWMISHADRNDFPAIEAIRRAAAQMG